MTQNGGMADDTPMADNISNVVSAAVTAPKLPEGIVHIASIPTTGSVDGCRVFTHYNGPTDQLNGLCVGMAVLDPGATPHPPHRHAEEEFLIVASGDGEIYVEGKTSQVGPGAIMYVAGNTEHGIRNTGRVPMTFYWSKWLAKGF